MDLNKYAEAIEKSFKKRPNLFMHSRHNIV